MNIKNIYECSFCKTGYSTKEECKACENTHSKPKNTYLIYEFNSKYPSDIIIKMDDDNEIRYKKITIDEMIEK